jgi:hypothetical protein
MNIAITLVHNKGNQKNSEQIEALKTFLKTVVDGPFFDPNLQINYTTTHHEIIGLPFPHTVKVYQAIPFGEEGPDNRYDLNSGGMVYYRNGDENKVGDHPRFFNWGLKRGTDNGADISIYIDDYTKLDITDLAIYLNSLIDPQDPHEFVDGKFGKLATLTLLKDIGQLKEDKSQAEAIADLKDRVVKGGKKNG